MSRPYDPSNENTRGMPSLPTDTFASLHPDGWRPPERLGGYRLLGPIGRGGMGVVYRAEDPRLSRQVAIKVMTPEAAARPGFRERFLREARAQGAVEHDNVVPVYAADEEQGVAYLVMPLLKGETLSSRLRRGTPPLAEAVRLAREIAEGVAAAHAAGLIHRDIKPANVWLDEAGRARLMDFGLACDASHAGEAPLPAGGVLGTPQYMAPEQADGRPVDGRADLFSLGCVLYEMLAGRRPFVGPTATAVLDEVRNADPPDVRGVPPALTALVRSLLAKAPSARPAGARQAADALRVVERSLVPTPRWPLAAVLAASLAWLLWPPAKPPTPPETPPEPAASGFPPLDATWERRAREYPRKRQAELVRAELMRRNPGFDGVLKVDYWEDDRYAKYAMNAFRLTDLTPLRAVPGLAALECFGAYDKRGDLASLEPLRGLQLRQVGFSYNPIRDLSPLEGQPINQAWLSQIDAEDLEPVYTLPLVVLHLTSLSPRARVEVGKLVGLKLRDVWLRPDSSPDFERLKEIPTLKEINGQPTARFWQECEGRRKRE